MHFIAKQATLCSLIMIVQLIHFFTDWYIIDTRSRKNIHYKVKQLLRLFYFVLFQKFSEVHKPIEGLGQIPNSYLWLWFLSIFYICRSVVPNLFKAAEHLRLEKSPAEHLRLEKKSCGTLLANWLMNFVLIWLY